MGVVAGEQLLDPARHEARHRGDIRDGVTPRQQPDHLKVPRRGRILGRPEPRFQILYAQMISNSRHGLPPRLMAHQPTRFATAQESKPSPSPGIRMTSWTSTPIRPRLTSPCATICSTTFRAMLIGTAKPIPTLPPLCEKMAVLIPISRPSSVTSVPPELPGLIDASVWMKSSYPAPASTPVRPSAETMPEVTVWPRPKGLPTASTKSPT